MFSLPSSGSANCRRVSLPACEDTTDLSQSAPVPSLAVFQLRLRDVAVDFGIEMADWLAANGAAAISGVTWAAAADSPKVPVIAGSGFDTVTGSVVVFVTPGAGAVAGDAYWLEATITIAAIAASAQNPIAYPARTLVRRINIVVVAG